MANSSQEQFGASNWAVSFRANAAAAAVTQTLKYCKPPTDTIPFGNSLAAGQTASGGTTTTMIDAGVRTETDEFWRNKLLKLTSGTNNGQVRLVTNSVSGTATLTFAPAVPAVIASSDTYDLYTATFINRLVVTGVQISGYNTNAADAEIKLRNHATTSAVLLQYICPKTTGVIQISEGGLWHPLIADEHLSLNISVLTGTIDVNVWGRTLTSTFNVADKYDGTA
jgi:hypothetical protein